MHFDDPKIDRVDHLLARASYFKASAYVHSRGSRVRHGLTEGGDPDARWPPTDARHAWATELRRYVKGRGNVRFNRCIAAAIAELEGMRRRGGSG
jgi:hypothetical protein